MSRSCGVTSDIPVGIWGIDGGEKVEVFGSAGKVESGGFIRNFLATTKRALINDLVSALSIRL